MQKIIIALVMFGAAIEVLPASNESEVMAPIRQFVDSFNNGDATTTPAGCSNVTAIIDDFSPFGWHGADACAKWMESYKAFAAANGNRRYGDYSWGSQAHRYFGRPRLFRGSRKLHIEEGGQDSEEDRLNLGSRLIKRRLGMAHHRLGVGRWLSP
jgi:hypothetical protein